jgi:alanyl-tRNA synthetase
VQTRVTTPEIAKSEGAMALFGEKYGETVRVVSMGFNENENQNYSVELCGGTHVHATGDIGLFKITSESSVASGVRRIEAVAGEEAEKYVKAQEQVLKTVSETLKCTPAGLAEKVEGLLVKIKQLEKDLKAKPTASAEDIEKVTLSSGAVLGVQKMDTLDVAQLRAVADSITQQIKSGVSVVFGVGEDKLAIIVAVTKDMVATYNAVDIARKLSEILGGKGGGGRPDFAQAGGSDVSKLEDAKKYLFESLK